EDFIVRSEIPMSEVAPGTWVLHDSSWGGAQIVVQHTDPLVVFRCKLFDLPDLEASNEAALFRKMLQLNGSDMVQGAYALEDSAVVVVEVLQSENLDENEFLAAVDSLTLAIVEHHDVLSELLS
ncbi:MAG TPA: hypothetical protein DCQ06_04280, partial [Myxococcales bacterium]|nr:hypothetical protein [Myxococcales bacterium]